MAPVQTLKLLVLGLIISFFIWFILLYPVQTLDSALKGLSIWWDVLFPALFPFFVISEVLLGFGIVHFFGSLFDPLMRPVFRVPGIGGFVMAMGFAAGYPIGAKLTSQLKDQHLINRTEGERLVAFTSTADPIFLIGAVAVGFFHDVGLAAILALSHYSSGIIVGICMRYHGDPKHMTPASDQGKGFILLRAFNAMHEARLKDRRPLGLLLKQAIRSSLQLVFTIGGLVVFFSVVLEILSLSNLLVVLSLMIELPLRATGIPDILSKAIVEGLFEVTLGAKSAGEENIGLIHKVAVAAFIISWAGLSVHAQIISILSHTDLRYRPFIIARLLHGVIASIIVYVMWDVMNPAAEVLSSVVNHWDYTANKWIDLGWLFMSALFVFMSVLFIIAVLYIVYRICKFIQSKLFY